MIRDSGERRGPKVSVIIPAYNAETFIASAIQSALDQSYPHLEVVVVDDGSTDGTAAVVQSFGERVRYVHKPNGGLASAWNTGIQQCSGELLAFLDADDIWMPGLVARQVELLVSRPEVDGVCVWARFIDERGQVLPDVIGPSFDGDLLRQLLVGGNSMLFSMVAVRKAVFDRVGPFDPAFRQAQDWDMTLRMAAAGVTFAAIPSVLVQRRLHRGNASADPERTLYWDLQVLGHALATLALPARVRALAPAATFWVLHRAALGNWRKGDRRAAVERMIEAFVSWPAALHRPQTYLVTIRRLQPSGFRGDAVVRLNLDRLTDEASRLLDEMFRDPTLPEVVRRRRRAAWAAFHAALAAFNLGGRRWRKAIAHALRSSLLHPLPALRGVAALALRAGRPRGEEDESLSGPAAAGATWAPREGT
jgi:glycosyltransferase involved in cell wall biosynthesis